MMGDLTEENILAVHKALNDAKVPTENRYMRISKSAFIELGGTEEDWKKLLVKQEPPTSTQSKRKGKK